jgi:hypothetical protein
MGTTPNPTRTRDRCEELGTQVLRACRALIAAGTYPSCDQLRRALPGHAGATLLNLRDALIADGTLAWPYARPKLGRPHREWGGLPCETEAQRALIWERARLVREGRDPDALDPMERTP